VSSFSEDLDQALRTIDPGPEPADDVMRRGKSIRLRRRMAAAAGAAAVLAAVLAGYPALTHSHSLAPSTVTDVPAGPGSAPGLVASGTAGNVSWQITFEPSALLGGRAPTREPGMMCISATLGYFMPVGCYPKFPPPGSSTHPAWFDDSGAESSQMNVQYALGVVDADVTSVVLRLRDGQQLKLIPVNRYGQRLVAYVFPMQVGIADVTVYLDNGRYAIASGIPPKPKADVWSLTPWVWHAPGGA
jgi:hypothetical protein